MPDEDDQLFPVQGTAVPQRKQAPPLEEDENLDEELPERPAPRKPRKKQREAAGISALTRWMLVGVAVLLVGAGVTLAVVFWPAGSKSEPTAERKLPGPGPENLGSGRPEPGNAESQTLAAGQKVYEAQDCARCHSSGGPMAGGGGPGRGRGPNLSKVGANPEHTVKWLTEHVRNPKSHKPGSRMPAYGGKISEEDLKSLAEYLASLK